MKKNVDKNYSPLISIIIPVYNSEGLIKRSILSVLNQTYRNIELLVIDDGSTDCTVEIADKFAKDDKRVTVIHKKNEGRGIARNIGIDNATGEYISFCDADDEMCPNMLKKMMDAIRRDGSDVAVCAWNYVDEHGNELNWFCNKRISKLLNSCEAQKEFLISDRIEGFCWNKLVKRDLYDLNNIRYDDEKISFCDIYANYRIIKAARRVSLLSDKLYRYYQIPTSCTHLSDIRMDYDFIEAATDVLQESQKSGLDEFANVYIMLRFYKHLYGMIKGRNLYNAKDFNSYYVFAFERFCKGSFFKTVSITIKYPIENPLKFLIKELIVSINYQRIKRM